MSVNGRAYEVGTVVFVNNTTNIVVIMFGIVIALCVGAAMAFITMKHVRRKKKGENRYCVWNSLQEDVLSSTSTFTSTLK